LKEKENKKKKDLVRRNRRGKGETRRSIKLDV
jgi:hypothetical protein